MAMRDAGAQSFRAAGGPRHEHQPFGSRWLTVEPGLRRLTSGRSARGVGGLFFTSAAAVGNVPGSPGRHAPRSAARSSLIVRGRRDQAENVITMRSSLQRRGCPACVRSVHLSGVPPQTIAVALPIPTRCRLPRRRSRQGRIDHTVTQILTVSGPCAASIASRRFALS